MNTTVDTSHVIKIETGICLEFDDSVPYCAVGQSDMDGKNINSTHSHSFTFHFFRPAQVIFRLTLLLVPLALLAWRLVDLGDELLQGEIHMSTSAGTFTGMTAVILQAGIILGLALISWWIIKTGSHFRPVPTKN